MEATAYKPIHKLNFIELWNAKKDRFTLMAKSPTKYPDLFGFKVPGTRCAGDQQSRNGAAYYGAQYA
jgi:hypothetical protein